MVLVVTTLPLVPSAEPLLLIQSISAGSSSQCLAGHIGTSNHWSSVSYLQRTTCFWSNQSPPFLVLRVPRDTLVLLVTSPPLVPSVEHMHLIEPISASPSPYLSLTMLLLITVYPSRAFRSTLASG